MRTEENTNVVELCVTHLTIELVFQTSTQYYIANEATYFDHSSFPSPIHIWLIPNFESRFCFAGEGNNKYKNYKFFHAKKPFF